MPRYACCLWTADHAIISILYLCIITVFYHETFTQNVFHWHDVVLCVKERWHMVFFVHDLYPKCCKAQCAPQCASHSIFPVKHKNGLARFFVCPSFRSSVYSFDRFFRHATFPQFIILLHRHDHIWARSAKFAPLLDLSLAKMFPCISGQTALMISNLAGAFIIWLTGLIKFW